MLIVSITNFSIGAWSRGCPITGFCNWIPVIGYPRVFHLNYARFNGLLWNVFYSFQNLRKALQTFSLKRNSQKTPKAVVATFKKISGREVKWFFVTSSLSKSGVFRMFSAKTKTQSRRFQISSKSVFKKLRFRDGLVWTVGLTVEWSCDFKFLRSRLDLALVKIQCTLILKFDWTKGSNRQFVCKRHENIIFWSSCKWPAKWNFHLCEFDSNLELRLRFLFLEFLTPNH